MDIILLKWLKKILKKETYIVLKDLFKKYEWVHISIGLIGNLSFFIGSVFFLYESLKLIGIWLFIVGSFGMMFGSVGAAVVKYEEKK